MLLVIEATDEFRMIRGAECYWWLRLLLSSEWSEELKCHWWLRLLMSSEWLEELKCYWWLRLLMSSEWLEELKCYWWLRLLMSSEWLEELEWHWWEAEILLMCDVTDEFQMIAETKMLLMFHITNEFSWFHHELKCYWWVWNDFFRYELSSGELAPYFSLGSCMEGLGHLFSALYGITLMSLKWLFQMWAKQWWAGPLLFSGQLYGGAGSSIQCSLWHCSTASETWAGRNVARRCPQTGRY